MLSEIKYFCTLYVLIIDVNHNYRESNETEFCLLIANIPIHFLWRASRINEISTSRWTSKSSIYLCLTFSHCWGPHHLDSQKKNITTPIGLKLCCCYIRIPLYQNNVSTDKEGKYTFKKPNVTVIGRVSLYQMPLQQSSIVLKKAINNLLVTHLNNPPDQ